MKSIVKCLIPGLLFVVLALAGCGPAASPMTTTTSQPTSTAYRLTHTAADVANILSWDTIVADCPGLAGQEMIDAFVVRGQTVKIGTDEQVSLGLDSPAAWGSTQIVRTDGPRTFAVEILFFDKPEYLEEYLLGIVSGGFILGTDGAYVIGRSETHVDAESSQSLVAGHQFAFSVTETAPAGQTLFCSREEVDGLVARFKQNVDALEITSLPWTIPARQK